MPDHAIYVAIAAAAVASFGLWWFHVVMGGLKKQSQNQRRMIYASVWLAYFVLTMIVIAQSQQ